MAPVVSMHGLVFHTNKCGQKLDRVGWERGYTSVGVATFAEVMSVSYRLLVFTWFLPGGSGWHTREESHVLVEPKNGIRSKPICSLSEMAATILQTKALVSVEAVAPDNDEDIVTFMPPHFSKQRRLKFLHNPKTLRFGFPFPHQNYRYIFRTCDHPLPNSFMSFPRGKSEMCFVTCGFIKNNTLSPNKVNMMTKYPMIPIA